MRALLAGGMDLAAARRTRKCGRISEDFRTLSSSFLHGYGYGLSLSFCCVDCIWIDVWSVLLQRYCATTNSCSGRNSFGMLCSGRLERSSQRDECSGSHCHPDLFYTISSSSPFPAVFVRTIHLHYQFLHDDQSLARIDRRPFFPRLLT